MAGVNHTLKDISTSANDDINKKSDDEYLKKIQSKFQSLELPSDFAAWTVQEQSDWVHYNCTELYQKVPESLESMIPSIFRPVDFSRSQEKLPEWIDMDKYRRGQKFVRDNYFSIIYSIFLGSIYGLTFDDGLKPIITSGQSYTPYLAFTRYLDTIKRMLSWHNGEPWVKGTKAYKDMQFARSKHLWINKKMSKMSNEQIVAASKIEDYFYLERNALLKDVAISCPFAKLRQHPYKMIENLFMTEAINNWIISIGQGCFIMAPIIYPQNVGIYDATDEDLEAFCHMWRCYGYFLGLEDEYNFCRGSLEEIKQRLRDLSEHWIKANFADLTPEWMHMTKSYAKSMNYYPFIYMTHKILTLLMTELLNVEMPILYASLTYREWSVYNLFKFFFRYALKFSIVRRIANLLMSKILNMASNFGAETLAKLQKKSDQYLHDFSIQS